MINLEDIYWTPAARIDAWAVERANSDDRVMTTFVPRGVFPDIVKATWYPGHMNAAMREIKQLLNTTDLLIEVRDARIPLSSRNPEFTSLLAQRPRIIVYNKIDLARLSSEDCKVVKSWEQPSKVVFQNAKQGFAISQLLTTIRHHIKTSLSVQGTRILVLGMPNVGKSTILNALRHSSMSKKKAARTGAQPGITRSTSSIFKLFDEPVTYLIDSPGIMVPFVSDSQTMLKLGLVNSVKDSIIDVITLADYLLYQLNLHDLTGYMGLYRTEQTNHVSVILEAIARRHGKLKRGGDLDLDGAAKTFVQDYRDGKLGHWCLDDIAPGSFDARVAEEGQALSKSQVRRGVTIKSVSQDSR